MPAVKFPNADDVARYISAIDPNEEFAGLTLKANLLAFQADTIYALADFLIIEARKFDLTHNTITPDQLKSFSEKLIEYAATLAPRNSNREAV